VSDNTKTIRIKWVRSGIGFSHYQKTIVRSLGLKYLNQVVVRPDTPQTRGVVASVPHLLEIVPEAAPPAWASIPEYTIVKRPETEAPLPSEPNEAEPDAEAASTVGAEPADEKAGAKVAKPEVSAPAKRTTKVRKKPVAKKAKPAARKEAKPKKTAKK
jgi:large subunit ribosomal protein L30